LIAVAGDDDVIEGLGAAGVGGDLDAIGVAADRDDLGAQADAIAKALDQGVDIARGAALDDAPGGQAGQREHAVVLEELDHEAHGEVVEGLRRARPHRCAEGHEVVIEEALRQAGAADVVAHGELAAGRAHEPRGRAVEAKDVAQHAPHVRAYEIARLGKDRAAAPLHAGAPALHAEAHLARQRAHAEPREETRERGIGAVVEDDEAGIDGAWPGAEIHGDGVGVAADAIRGLEHGDLVFAREQIRSDQAGDAGTYDSDAHEGRK
jgi:hypothetical protein